MFLCGRYLFSISDSGKLMTFVQLIIKHTVTTVFWQVKLYTLIGGYQCCREKFCLHLESNSYYPKNLKFHILYRASKSFKILCRTLAYLKYCSHSQQWCQIQRFLHVSLPQPCLPQQDMTASWNCLTLLDKKISSAKVYLLKGKGTLHIKDWLLWFELMHKYISKNTNPFQASSQNCKKDY